jgi:3-oxoacyl-[acyl-carrier-protein] synthase II
VTTWPSSAAWVADIVAAGAVRPGPAPVTRPAPAGVAREPWPAYRLDADTEQALSPPDRIKRMGRGQAMAIVAVQRALASWPAGVPTPDDLTAVLVGTAWAEEGDEIVFLENLIKLGEKGAKPAFFVNSVKNALASQLALSFAFRGENQTFAHDALSFESALWQGTHLVRAGRARHAVVCGVDALVEFQEIHGHLLGWYRTDPAPLSPLAAPGSGTIPGEGAAAFVLGAPGTATSRVARLVYVKSRGPLQRMPALSARDELDFADQAVRESGTKLDANCLVVLGANGDAGLDAVYAEVAQRLGHGSGSPAVGVYRHLTGDFATASALGFEIAVRAVTTRAVPADVRLVKGQPGSIEQALLYHVSSAGYRSAIVVSA